MNLKRFPDKCATKLVPSEYDKSVSIVRECVPYEPLLIEDIGGARKHVSDVSLLFNQQRLDRMSLCALKQKLDEQAQLGDNGLSEIRKNIKDEDLHKFVKSRYIQSLSELRQWSHYLTTNYVNEVGRIKDALTPKPPMNPTAPTGAAPAAPTGAAPAAPAGE